MLLIDGLLLKNNYFGQNIHKNALLQKSNCKNKLYFNLLLEYTYQQILSVA